MYVKKFSYYLVINAYKSLFITSYFAKDSLTFYLGKKQIFFAQYSGITKTYYIIPESYHRFGNVIPIKIY